MTQRFESPYPPDGPDTVYPTEPIDRPRVNGARLWSGGAATAVVAVLVAVVGVLIARALFEVALGAPREVGALGDRSTVVLCVVAGVAALAATGLAHLLLLSTPRPLAYFRWIVGLATAAVVVWPFLTAGSLATKATYALIYLVLGIAIGTLVSGAAAAASRPVAGRYYR